MDLINLLTCKLQGGNIDIKSNQEKILDIIDKSNLKKEYNDLIKLSKEELINKINEQDKIINILETEKQKKQRIKKDIEDYTLINYYKFLRTEDGKLYKNNEDNQFYLYNPLESAFDRNIRTGDIKFRDYQKNFIQDWSVSQQELVILYYGVGTGKTLIAVNCAEQFLEITNDSKVYFVLPSSLVLNTILECYSKGIDPSRKNSKGEYLYNFISYQQLLISNFDFDDNSLLIIDEIHNLRNIRSSEIKEKVSARKYKATDTFSLVGNKLSQELIKNSNKFIRKIFLSGTLFVNSSQDLEPIIAIGYNREPYLNFSKDSYEILLKNEQSFKTYFQGLISYYKIEGMNKKQMPTVKYEFIPITYQGNEKIEEDPFYINTRNESNSNKCKYIINYIENNKNEKILIYSQFLDRSLNELISLLNKNNIKFGFISGKLNQVEKLNIVNQYNTNEIKILIFTLSIKEGISFKETNTIFIMQPYWNYAILEQILARGIRLNSHVKGEKSIINCKFLVGVDNINITKKWINNANQIMKNDIKSLVFPVTEKNDKIYDNNNFGSRDIDLYNRMFIKQEEINIFEKKLLRCV
jgi:superfamily II DNA or RNA helicase